MPKATGRWQSKQQGFVFEMFSPHVRAICPLHVWVLVLFDRCEPLSLNAITPFDVRRPERYESYRKDVKFFTDRALCLPHLLSAICLFSFSISLILSLFFPLLFQTGVCGHQHKFIRRTAGCVGRGCSIIKN